MNDEPVFQSQKSVYKSYVSRDNTIRMEMNEDIHGNSIRRMREDQDVMRRSVTPIKQRKLNDNMPISTSQKTFRNPLR